MTLITDDTLPSVAIDFMNEDHAAAGELINQLHAELEQLASGADQDRSRATALLEQFCEHNRAHFAHEQREMERTGFPVYPVHKGEHDRVLAELAQVVLQWKDGMEAQDLQRYLSGSVVPWLVNHIDTMDTVTAMFIARQG